MTRSYSIFQNCLHLDRHSTASESSLSFLAGKRRCRARIVFRPFLNGTLGSQGMCARVASPPLVGVLAAGRGADPMIT